MTTLAVELTASRLLGSVFGTSNIVWANIIGLMLIYLTCGYFIGGRIADRSPQRKTLYRILIVAAFLSALIPLIARPILYAAGAAFSSLEAALTIGSFVSVLLLFSVPVTLLGMTSPFAIRLAVTDVQNAGRVSGQIYAISTGGSIVGTFLPVLWLIPEIGTTATFLLFAGILYVVAMLGLLQENGVKALIWLWMPVLIFVVTQVVSADSLRPPETGKTLIFEDETAYNYIQVQEDEHGFRYLYLNEGQGIHSLWHPTQIMYGRTWDYFLTAPYFNANFSPDDMDSLLIIGLATGTIARQHIDVYGDIPIDGIEIDPGIIQAGRDYFQMNEAFMPSLTTYAEDGRYILNQLERKYTVIGIDAYRPPYIPWHLTTVEFFEEVREHLAENGVVAINVGRTSTDRRLVDALANTLQQVYPSVYSIDVPQSFNTIIVATQQPVNEAHLLTNIQALPPEVHPALQEILSSTPENLRPLASSDILFTDDRAPVETLVDSLVLNFLLGGDLETLR